MTDSFLKLSSSCSLSLSVSSILMLFLMPPITSMFHTQLRGPSPWTLMWTPAVLTNVRSEKREILQIIFFHNVRSDKRRRFGFTWILSLCQFSASHAQERTFSLKLLTCSNNLTTFRSGQNEDRKMKTK